MKSFSLSSVADHLMPRGLAEAVANENLCTADVLAWIAEFDARKLYLPAAYPSMYDYCLRELHLSEDQAGKRIRAARAARDFPVIFEMVADQRLSLSAVVALVPKLDRENAAELLAAAAHKTRAEVELLLAELFPRPDAPTSLRAVPEQRAGSPDAVVPPESPAEDLVAPAAAAAPAGLFVLGAPEESAHSPAPGRVDPAQGAERARAETPQTQRPRVAPLSPGRYELRVTLDQETHDLLRKLQALLAHSVPSGDVPEILKRALKLAVLDAERRRYAATSKPGAKRGSKNPRHIPTDVRRAVHERDGEQCTFVSATGHRCEEKRLLEYDHVQPVARGGQATVENTRLRCRAHNQYEAERTFGAGFMREKRQAARARAETSSMLRGVATERAQMRGDVLGAKKPGSAVS